MSWCISTHSKKLNVYTHQEKIDAFAKIYADKITVDPESIVKYLDQYKNYLDWVERHFTVSSYFYYEKHMPDLEKYILNLDIFHGTQRLSWKDTFDIDFQDWNRCHYLTSDLSGIGHQLSVPQLTYDAPAAKLELQS